MESGFLSSGRRLEGVGDRNEQKRARGYSRRRTEEREVCNFNMRTGKRNCFQ